ncbi:hypothetical protein C8Q80DRAFT_813308 [Daedaleopsis nitida]|nr:hypothetical protein C8Q80DRAFT_813308 [Daedaleopsis nitida]
MSLCSSQVIYTSDAPRWHDCRHSSLLLNTMATRPESPDFAAMLPTEIWDYILAELPTEDLRRCQLVCSRFAAIVQVIDRRYEGALTVSAMADCRNSSIPLRRRTEMVRQYHRAWEQLSLPRERLGGRGTPDGVYVLSSHVRHMPAPLFLSCGWLSIVNPDLGLLFVRAPAWSNLKEPRNNGWWVAGQLFPSQLPGFVAYRIDPSQDLLILMSDTEEDEDGEELSERDIHVRSLSTGLQHPLAARPTLDQSEAPIYELSSFRVFGDLCAILARCNDSDDDRVLHIWDWHSGDLLFSEAGYHAWGDVISSLGPRTILVAHDECLQIHTFSADGELRSDTLELPRFLPDAVQVWTTVSQPHTQAEPGRGFACDPASEIVIINMTRIDTGPNADVADGELGKYSILLVIKVSALLDIAQQDGPPPLSVPWAQWGPDSSRFLEVPETCLWEAPTTFGRRALIPFYHGGVPTLSVLDFDFVPQTPSWGEPPQAFETSGEWVSEMLEAPVTEDWSRWLEEEDRFVTSNVPCRIRSRRFADLPARMVGASLYENGLVVKIADDDQCDYMVLPLRT